MEDKNNVATNTSALQFLFVQQTLNSWRFFLLFSIPPVIWVVFVASPGLPRALIALLCGIVWFGCWRLWLDTCYLKLIHEENNAHAGVVLAFIWRCERLQALSLAERQQGALKQCRRTMWFIGSLWVSWLAALL